MSLALCYEFILILNIMKKVITDFSEQLAREIAERNVYDINDIAALIESRVNMCVRDIVDEYTTQAEMEYMRLLDRQSKNKIGGTEYILLGYKIAAAKQKKAAANRASNNMRKEDEYSRLKDFVEINFGKDVLDEFFRNLVEH